MAEKVEVVEEELPEGYVLYVIRGFKGLGTSSIPTMPGGVGPSAVGGEEVRIRLARVGVGFASPPSLTLSINSTTPDLGITTLRLTEVGVSFREPGSVSLSLDSEIPSLPLVKPWQLIPIEVSFSNPSLVSLVINEEVLISELLSIKASLQPITVSFNRPSTISLQLDNNYYIPREVTYELKPVSVTFAQPKRVSLENINQETIGLSSIVVNTTATTTASKTTELGEGEVVEVGEIVDKVSFGLGRVVPDRPLVIIAKRGDGFGYIEFLKRVLREVYRVRVGGLPNPKHLGHAEELTLLMPIEVGAGGRLFVIDLTSGNLRELLKDDVRLARIRGRIRDRLRELFSQGFGFIVIYGDGEHRDYASNDYENIKDSKKENKEDYVSKFISGIWIKFFDENVALEYHSTVPSPIEVGPVIANSSREFYVFVANLMWGRVGGAVMSYDEVVRRFGSQQSDNDNKNRNSIEDAFDRFVVWLEDGYWRSLEGSVRDFDVQVLVRPSVEGDEGGRESMSHYLTKAFIVNYLIRELTEEFRDKGVAKDEARSRALGCIETEYRFGDVRFDVYVKPGCGSRFGGLVVEVETLYGTDTVLHKVLNTIEGRISSGVGRLWVVIPNPQAIIYLPQLLRLEMRVRREYKGDVEFHTLDMTSGAPVRLVDVARRLLSRWRELGGG
jgi:hypothetical protein